MAADDVRGIQSIELGGSVLEALVDVRGEAVPLREVAQAAGMTASKARRYLLSFARVGLVAQDERTGYYELGPLAIRLGLAAISAISVERVAPPIVRDLRQRLEETVVLAIWSANGPTVLQVAASRRPVTLNALVGSTMPLTRSATGIVFGAFFDPAATAPLIDRDFNALPRSATARARREYAAQLEDTRRHGVAHVEGVLLPGVSSLSAPVFGHAGAMVAALGVLGHRDVLDVRPEGPVAGELKRAARLLSERCGYAPK